MSRTYLMSDISVAPIGIDSTGVTNGQVLAYDSGSGKWKPGIAVGLAANNTFTGANTVHGARFTVNDTYVVPGLPGGGGGYTADTNVILSAALTQSDGATRPVGAEIYYAAAPAVAPTADCDFHGVDLHLVTSIAANQNSHVHLYALEAKAEHGIPGTINEMYGALFESVVETSASAIVQNAYSIKTFNQALAGAKIQGNSIDVWALGPTIDTANGSAVQGNAFGLYVSGFHGLGGGAGGVTGASEAIHVADGPSTFNDIVTISNAFGSTAQIALTVDNSNATRGVGKFASQFNGYDFGLGISTIHDNATGIALSVTKSGTGAGAAAVIVNKGTGRTLDCQIGATPTSAFVVNSLGSVIVGQGAALATTATDGDLYITTCAGTPTGVPSTHAGSVALRYDTTNNKLWVYNGAWKGVVLA